MTLPGFFEGTGMPDPGWWEALFPDPAGILRSAGLSRGSLAVDLCSGDGWFTLQMARIARHVIAVDIDAKMLETNRELARKFSELERRVGKHDQEIAAILEAIRQLMTPPEKPRREIGFHVRENAARYRIRKRA